MKQIFFCEKHDAEVSFLFRVLVITSEIVLYDNSVSLMDDKAFGIHVWRIYLIFFYRVFVGTVSEFCTKHADCPVVVIKRKADETPEDPVDD